MEVRRIREEEAEAVAALWSDMNASVEDGGPLTAQGHRRIANMLAATAWHRQECCFVACDGTQVVGFIIATLHDGSGLLPELVGEIRECFVVPAARGRGVSRSLAQSALGWLRQHGADPIHKRVCVDAQETQGFWRTLGFDLDMVCLSRYYH